MKKEKSMNDQGYTIDIQELAYLLVKRWYLILGCTVIMGIAGYAFGTNSDRSIYSDANPCNYCIERYFNSRFEGARRFVAY